MTVQERISDLEAERTALVDRARGEGASWQQIADALGVRRQSAWETFQRGRSTLDRIGQRSDLTAEQAETVAADVIRDVRRAGGRRARK